MPFDGVSPDTNANRIRNFYGDGSNWGRWYRTNLGPSGKIEFCLMGAIDHAGVDAVRVYDLMSRAIDQVDPQKKRIKRLGHERGVDASGYYVEQGWGWGFKIANFNNACTSFKDIEHLLDVMEEIELKEMSHAV